MFLEITQSTGTQMHFMDLWVVDRCFKDYLGKRKGSPIGQGVKHPHLYLN